MVKGEKGGAERERAENEKRSSRFDEVEGKSIFSRGLRRDDEDHVESIVRSSLNVRVYSEGKNEDCRRVDVVL